MTKASPFRYIVIEHGTRKPLSRFLYTYDDVRRAAVPLGGYVTGVSFFRELWGQAALDILQPEGRE